MEPSTAFDDLVKRRGQKGATFRPAEAKDASLIRAVISNGRTIEDASIMLGFTRESVERVMVADDGGEENE